MGLGRASGTQLVPVPVMDATGRESGTRLHSSTGPTLHPIEAVVIACFRYDTRLVRICAASVRHWYPDIPIYLLKDESQGSFSTRGIERSHNVKVLNCEFKNGGWGLSKLAVLFGEGPQRVLLLDSDTVMIGHVLDMLEKYGDDFVVTGISNPDSDDKIICRDYVDTRKIREEFDPNFVYPGFGFNSGHVVLTRNRLSPKDFQGVVEFKEGRILSVAPPGLFPYADQGILNYVLARAVAHDVVRVTYAEFWCWSAADRAREFLMDEIAIGRGFPTIIHWAGTKRWFLNAMDRADILTYFKRKYYSRFAFGWWMECWDEGVRYLMKAGKFLKRLRT